MARQRAIPDGALGLDVVVCAGCGLACARRPTWRRRRRLIRTVGAWRRLVRGLILSVVFLAPLAALTVGQSKGFGDMGASVSLGVMRGDPASALARSLEGDRVYAVAAWVGLAFAAGLWLTVSLRHVRQPLFWAGWCATLSLLVSADAAYGVVEATAAAPLDLGWRYSGPELRELALRGVALALTVLLMACGGGAGVLVRRADPALRSARWRRRLARARKRRLAA